MSESDAAPSMRMDKCDDTDMHTNQLIKGNRKMSKIVQADDDDTTSDSCDTRALRLPLCPNKPGYNFSSSKPVVEQEGYVVAEKVEEYLGGDVTGRSESVGSVLSVTFDSHTPQASHDSDDAGTRRSPGWSFDSDSTQFDTVFGDSDLGQVSPSRSATIIYSELESSAVDVHNTDSDQQQSEDYSSDLLASIQWDEQAMAPIAVPEDDSDMNIDPVTTAESDFWTASCLTRASSAVSAAAPNYYSIQTIGANLPAGHDDACDSPLSYDTATMDSSRSRSATIFRTHSPGTGAQRSSGYSDSVSVSSSIFYVAPLQMSPSRQALLQMAPFVYYDEKELMTASTEHTSIIRSSKPQSIEGEPFITDRPADTSPAEYWTGSCVTRVSSTATNNTHDHVEQRAWFGFENFKAKPPPIPTSISDGYMLAVDKAASKTLPKEQGGVLWTEEADLLYIDSDTESAIIPSQRKPYEDIYSSADSGTIQDIGMEKVAAPWCMATKNVQEEWDAADCSSSSWDTRAMRLKYPLAGKPNKSLDAKAKKLGKTKRFFSKIRRSFCSCWKKKPDSPDNLSPCNSPYEP